jgi:hypothetical protein
MLAGGDAAFVRAADGCATIDWSNAAAVVAAIADPGLAAALRSRSPTSLVAILESHLVARKLPGIREVLAVEWIRDQAAAGFVDEASFFRRDQ